MTEKSPGLAMRCVRGSHRAMRSGAVNAPIYASTTFALDSTAELLADLQQARA